MKSLCKTLADRAQELQFVNLYLESHNFLCESQYKFDIEVIAKAPVLLQAKTEDIGIALEFLSRQDELPTSVQQVYQSGIYLGSSILLKLCERQEADVLHWIRQAHSAAPEEFGDLAYQYARVLKVDRLREGDHIVLLDSDTEG